MSSIFNIDEAKTNLSCLIDRATAGEDVVIARAGKPMVRLAPVTPRAPRVPGLFRHLVGPEPRGAFDPLTDAELADWE